MWESLKYTYITSPIEADYSSRIACLHAQYAHRIDNIVKYANISSQKREHLLSYQIFLEKLKGNPLYFSDQPLILAHLECIEDEIYNP